MKQVANFQVIGYKDGNLEINIEGSSDDIITLLVNCMINEPDTHELFDVAVKGYETYKKEFLSN